MESLICGTRTAHPTKDLNAIRKFYDALGLIVLTSFSDHDGYSGIIYSFPGAPHELEFTFAGRASLLPWSDETLLVFYVGTAEASTVLVDRLDRLGAPRVESKNPFWDRGGLTFLDPDGRRVVIFCTHS